MGEAEEINLNDIEIIFREHHKMLCKVAYAIVRDKNTAEDIVQDVFLTLWRKRKELTIDSNLKGYLYRAVSNSCLNHLQSYHKRNIKPTENFSEQALGSYVSHDKVDYDQLDDAIQKAIDKLPPRCKVIFVLSRFEGLKYQQIAEALNVSAKTVENQMGIALVKLREELKPFLKKDK
ncbi:MAG TPA: RNA polymerase sigma-70 factor [Cytophagaceae bacterium]|jgi:RNA polymerase sigma-70 factor (ECF subfamily)|nr:RNA polymerase sigma-70 factor [Cytophagaceae bacterium]